MTVSFWKRATISDKRVITHYLKLLAVLSEWKEISIFVRFFHSTASCITWRMNDLSAKVRNDALMPKINARTAGAKTEITATNPEVFCVWDCLTGR